MGKKFISLKNYLEEIKNSKETYKINKIILKK
jgi:hypothetical protein